MANYKNTLLSTSALAKRLELAPKTLFELLLEKGWIERSNDQWKLTGKGQFEGGDYVNSKKYGEYIGWPEDILENKIFSELFNRPLRTRLIAEELNISSHRFNALLVERGWQRRYHRGWVLTDEGRAQGGIESEDEDVGVPFTMWPRQILDNPWLQSAMRILRDAEDRLQAGAIEKPDNTMQTQPELALEIDDTSNNCFETLDGHRVNCAEDAVVDNWLYLMNVAHSYHHQLQNSDLGNTDFYIPVQQLSIEVWHREERGPALSQKLARLEHFKSAGKKFIEISQDDILELDKTLPKALLKQGITVF